MTFVRKLSDVQESELIEDYEDGWTVNELTIIYRVSVRTVYRVLAKYKVPRQVRSKHKRTPLKRKSKKPKPRELKPCGTNAAYARHKYRGEYPCTACLEAHAQNVKEAKEKRRKRDKARTSDLARRQRREVRDLSA